MEITNPTFDGDISFKNSETASVVSGLMVTARTATAQSDVGSYDITASGATGTPSILLLM